MIEIINVITIGVDALIAVFFALIYLLNVFKKKTLLDRIGAYDGGFQGFSFVMTILFGLFTAAGFVVEPDKMYGFSLGASLNMTVLGIGLAMVLVIVISEWFENLPET